MTCNDLTIPVPEIRRRVAARELDWSEDQIREYAVARAAERKDKCNDDPKLVVCSDCQHFNTSQAGCKIADPFRSCATSIVTLKACPDGRW